MRIYLAGTFSRKYVHYNEDGTMRIYLAGPTAGNIKGYMATGEPAPGKDKPVYNDVYILESYYYAHDKQWFPEVIKHSKDFLLDSGTFTFIKNIEGNQAIDWDGYLKRYADYINEHDVKLFFELDVDLITGIEKVEQMRDYLEKRTGKKSIPVWHKTRGIDYWKKMCEDYDYVAIGGIASGHLKKSEYKHFTPMINYARSRGTRVHGLGFTNLQGIKKYRFYSVDSTAWIYGNRGGFIYKFDQGTMRQIPSPDGKQLNSRQAAIHNFTEWIKFQHHADKYYR